MGPVRNILTKSAFYYFNAVQSQRSWTGSLEQSCHRVAFHPINMLVLGVFFRRRFGFFVIFTRFWFNNSCSSRPTLLLTLSSTVVSNGYTSKCLGRYWSNPPFNLLFWHSGTLALGTEPQSARMSKNVKGRLVQYGAERFDKLIFATIRKSVGLKGLTLVYAYTYCGKSSKIISSQRLLFLSQ